MKNPSIFVVFECFELRKATATTPEAAQLHTNNKNELSTQSEHTRNLKFKTTTMVIQIELFELYYTKTYSEGGFVGQ